jgi:hypothetical protein
MRAPLQRERALGRGYAAAPPGLGAARGRAHGERAPPAPATLPAVRRRNARRASSRGAAGSLRPAPAGGGRHPRGQEPRLAARRCGARARALRLPSRERNDRCHRAGCGRRARGASRPASRSRALRARRQHREDRLAHGRRAAHASGACSAGRRHSSAAPRVATAARPRCCSARSSRGSPARTAGGPFDYLDPKRRQLCSRPPGARLHRPQRGPRRPEGLRRGRPRDRRRAVRRLGRVPRGR